MDIICPKCGNTSCVLEGPHPMNEKPKPFHMWIMMECDGDDAHEFAIEVQYVRTIPEEEG